jgi:low temperature requirement protein LtrA
MGEGLSWSIPIWSRPRMNQDWGHEQRDRELSWPELFYDLIYVVATKNLAATLSSGDWIDFLVFPILFTPIWWAWTFMNGYVTRFFQDDLAHRIFFFFQMLGVAAIVISVPHVLKDNGYFFIFVGGIFLMRSCLLVANLVTAVYLPRARFHCITSIVHFCCGLMVWSGACLSTLLWRGDANTLYYVQFAFTLVASLMEVTFLLLYICIGTIFKLKGVPVHVAHTAERYSNFVIIGLGESVFAIGGATKQLPSLV